MDWFKGKSNPDTIDFPIEYVFENNPLTCQCSRIRGLFKLIERLFGAGISDLQDFWSVMAQKSKNNVNDRSINPGWFYVD